MLEIFIDSWLNSKVTTFHKVELKADSLKQGDFSCFQPRPPSGTSELKVQTLTLAQELSQKSVSSNYVMQVKWPVWQLTSGKYEMVHEAVM